MKLSQMKKNRKPEMSSLINQLRMGPIKNNQIRPLMRKKTKKKAKRPMK